MKTRCKRNDDIKSTRTTSIRNDAVVTRQKDIHSQTNNVNRHYSFKTTLLLRREPTHKNFHAVVNINITHTLSSTTPNIKHLSPQPKNGNPNSPPQQPAPPQPHKPNPRPQPVECHTTKKSGATSGSRSKNASP